MEFPSFNFPSLPACISSRLPSVTVQEIKESGRALISSIFEAMNHPIDGFAKPAWSLGCRTVANYPRAALSLGVVVVAYVTAKLTKDYYKTQAESSLALRADALIERETGLNAREETLTRWESEAAAGADELISSN